MNGSKWKGKYNGTNLWYARRKSIREKYIATHIYLKKLEKGQINNPTLHLKELEGKQQMNPAKGRK